MNVGNFVTSVISFTIIAFAVFLLVKGANALRANHKAKTEGAPPAPEHK